LKISESSRNDVARIAMHATGSAATALHTKARRCVMVRAMKSLTRMSSASVLQSRRLYNGWLVLPLAPGFSPVHVARSDSSRFNGFSRHACSSKPLKTAWSRSQHRHRHEGRLIRTGIKTFRYRKRIARFFDLVREGIHRTIQASRAAELVLARLDQTSAAR
jgi:hypothetical protein